MENKTKSPHHKATNSAQATQKPKQKPTPAPEPINTPINPPMQNNNIHKNGLAVASMVVGIIALLMCTIPIIGLILGIIALVLGIMGLKKTDDRGMAIAGISTGGLSIFINILTTIFVILSITLFGEIMSQADYTHNDSNQVTETTNKEFAKDEVAVFGNYKVKVNSVTRNYSPKDEIDKASGGNELVVVNVSVKNADQNPTHFSTSDLRLNADGAANYATFLNIEPSLTSGVLSSGETVTGNIVFEVKKDAASLKLQYESYDQIDDNTATQGTRKTIYTLTL